MSTTKKETTLEKLVLFCSSGYSYFLFVTIIKKFDFFNKIKTEKNNTVTDLAKKLKIKERPLQVVIQLLMNLGCIKKTKKEKIILTNFAKKCLLKSSKDDLTSYILMRYNYAEIERNLINKISEVLKTDVPLKWGNSEWGKSLNEEKTGKEFTKAMDSRGRSLAKTVSSNLKLTNSKKLLDLGGSSGIYSKELTKKNPGLTAIVLDKGSVIKTQKNSKKVKFISGNFFEDNFPENCDVILLSNILHDWDKEQNIFLIKKIYNYLPEKGKLVVYDGDIDESVTSVEHSVILMLFTKGRTYTKEETKKMLETVGFKKFKFKKLPYKRIVLIAEK